MMLIGIIIVMILIGIIILINSLIFLDIVATAIVIIAVAVIVIRAPTGSAMTHHLPESRLACSSRKAKSVRSFA